MKRRARSVAAGERLDLGFGPAPALLGLGGGDEARAAQVGKLGRVPVGVRGGEGLDRRGAVIVAEDAGDGIDEGAFAVGAAAVQEEQRMLAGHAGQRVAAHPLQILLQRLVAGR